MSLPDPTGDPRRPLWTRVPAPLWIGLALVVGSLPWAVVALEVFGTVPLLGR